ncbi:MAG TPA: IclR family transcriptional regulator [Castellaniella sp.]|uniref:IclR family transcriptional regulator n=1 Tax=Castellaniella sp. TaxID=1955812 RepID=UPI002EE89430
MSSSLQKSLSILELLAKTPSPMPLRDIAEFLDSPPATVHRLLKLLSEAGYVRQDRSSNDYYLSLKLASLGLIGLSNTGIHGVAQPLLDRMANETGELVRLGLIENERLVFIAKATVARYGLRYDPDAGQEAPLCCTASGQAWLLNLSDEEALRIVTQQGFPPKEQHGPNAPATIHEFLDGLAEARKRGYGLNINASMDGITAIAVPIIQPKDRRVVGALAISGPSSRLTKEIAETFLPMMQKEAAELSGITLYPTL